MGRGGRDDGPSGGRLPSVRSWGLPLAAGAVRFCRAVARLAAAHGRRAVAGGLAAFPRRRRLPARRLPPWHRPRLPHRPPSRHVVSRLLELVVTATRPLWVDGGHPPGVLPPDPPRAPGPIAAAAAGVLGCSRAWGGGGTVGGGVGGVGASTALPSYPSWRSSAVRRRTGAPTAGGRAGGVRRAGRRPGGRGGRTPVVVFLTGRDVVACWLTLAAGLFFYWCGSAYWHPGRVLLVVMGCFRLLC